MNKYNFSKIEKKWQTVWRKQKTYEPNFKKAKKSFGTAQNKPFYNLMMFPYPSAEGLHVGNMYAFVGSDIYGRFKRMQGYDVFEPIGLDGFGIHSENYAMKIGAHPMKQTKISEKGFYKQLEIIGNGFAWEEKLETYDPEYYKWTQWIFIQLFKKGLAYRKKAPVNWCLSCKTVLADEQVVNDKCERCSSVVVKKELEQWFFKITDYAEKLLQDLEKIDWSEKVKIAQKNWIGKSEGVLIEFKIQNSKFKIQVFTTRPDTLFGATYMVLSPEHPLIANCKLQIANYRAVEQYIIGSKKKSPNERIENKNKTGVELKGVKAINPANGAKIPIWVSDYILSGYGTGAIMAVPAHDERDFEFAQKFQLPIKMVVCPHYPAPTCPVLDKAYEGDGHLVNSGKFTGMKADEAKWSITEFVGGQKKIQYHLRDWLISRQRYWGPPIPLVFCESCKIQAGNSKFEIRNSKFSTGELENPGWVAIPENDLPVKLPYVKDFRPTGTDKSPLTKSEKFYKVRCPKCHSWAYRETDVSDTFLDSAWYYIGYLMIATNWKLEIGNWKLQEAIRKWLPVDMYIGGAEHSVLHLLYTRFLAKAFHDWGLVNFNEPFTKFRAHGLLIKEGAKMSKSKGNVVNPDEYVQKFGADALRMYLMFLAPFEQGGDFRDSGILGITRFLERVWKLYLRNYENVRKYENEQTDSFVVLNRLLNQTIKKVTEDIENLQYNTAISALMILLNEIEKNLQSCNLAILQSFLKLLAPFAPHIAEELWWQLQEVRPPNIDVNIRRSNLPKLKSIHREPWPTYDLQLIKEENFDLVIQINGKYRGTVKVEIGANQKEAEKIANSLPNIQVFLKDKKIQKIIFVKNRLINFVLPS